MTKPRPKPPGGDSAASRWAPGRPMGLSRALMKAGYGTRRWADYGADFYAAHLERAIQESQARLQQAKQP